MGKKGLSEVIIVVLLILIVLVALGILWTFVGSTFIKILGGNGNQGEVSQILGCLNSEVKVVECGQVKEDIYFVNIKRGAGDLNLDGIRIKLKDFDNKEKIILNSTYLPLEFEGKSYLFNFSELELNGLESSSISLELDGGPCGFSLEFMCLETIESGGSGNNSEGNHSQNNLTLEDEYLLNVSTNILLNQNGKKTFTISYQGKNLRSNYSDEVFFEDKSGGNIIVDYNIVDVYGGVDVVYTVINPTNSPQRVPDLRIDGIKISNISSDNVEFLKAKSSTGMQKINFQSSNYIDTFYPSNYYSPVIVMRDEDFSAGTALEYPYLDYKQNVRNTLSIINNINSPRFGTWSHRYRNFTEPDGLDSYVPAFENRSYNISLRFSNRNNWIFTLSPYKRYFEGLYGKDSGNVNDRKRLPVLGIQLGDSALTSSSNPRGYRGVHGSDGRIDINGWGPFTDWFIQQVLSYGYTRVLIWAPGGVYDQSEYNFPPQFMSDWPVNASLTDENLTKYQQNGIELGFWWGRSTQIPEPIIWNPQRVVDADYTNQSHINFLTNEINIAVGRGAKLIGLDMFTQMPVYQRYYWVDEMKFIAPGVLFSHESAGPDLLHRKIANHDDPFTWGDIRGPDLLAWYLNPSSTIYVQGKSANYNNLTFMQEMSKWGYTPLPKDSLTLNASQINQNLIECNDGIDQRGDGRVDYYDCGCLAGSEIETGTTSCLYGL